MITDQKALSVKSAASLCSVGRSTITYWIRAKKLHADRSGKSYLIPIDELLLFLKSSGKNIPRELKSDNFHRPIFRTFQHCWEYWKGNHQGYNCNECVVSANHLDICFTAKKSEELRCLESCIDCRYYQDIYLPRIQLIYQIEYPAAVYNGLYLWGGNKKWAELCGVQEKELVGLGIEHIVHPDSLEVMISIIKKKSLGQSEPDSFSLFLKNGKGGRLSVTIYHFPISRTPGSFLLLCKPDDD